VIVTAASLFRTAWQGKVAVEVVKEEEEEFKSCGKNL
jgi:hypothetical protein